MMRIIAFILNAEENLAFTKGLCVDDEPEIWRKSLSDEIELWIDFGQLDEKRISEGAMFRLSQGELWVFRNVIS